MLSIQSCCSGTMWPRLTVYFWYSWNVGRRKASTLAAARSIKMISIGPCAQSMPKRTNPEGELREDKRDLRMWFSYARSVRRSIYIR